MVSTSRAAVIYSNLATPSAVSGEVVGVDSPDTYEIADAFVPSQTYQLTLGMASVHSDTGSAPLVANIWSNSGGSPGSILTSATVPSSSIASSRTTVTFTFPGGVNLLANTMYWFSLTSTANTDYVWTTTNNVTTYPEKYRINSGAWNGPDSPMSTFEVDGTAVPEPSSIFQLAVLISMAFFIRRAILRCRNNYS